MRRRQGTNKVDMYMCKSSEGNRNVFRANVNMAEDLSLLALKAGFAKPLQTNLVEIRHLDA